MLKEHLLDLEAGYGEMWACAWRCVNCGHRDDAVIQQHRLAQTASRVARLETVAHRAEATAICAADPVEQLAA